MSSSTVDELIISAMARELSGEVLVSSVTAFGALAGLLARATHAPDLGLLATPESGMDAGHVPTLTLGQFFTNRNQGIALGMEELFDAIFRDRFRIWINPAQIDRWGNVNISAVGDWNRPKVALVGSRGIPEDTSHLSRLLYYLLDHNPRTVVDQVDFRSGAGNSSERARDVGALGSPTVLVTNLGVFDFQTGDGHMRIRSLHPGVTLDMVQKASGFRFADDQPIPQTPTPNEHTTALIRQSDPLDMRTMELSKGPQMAEKMAAIYRRERALLNRGADSEAPR